MELKVRIKTPEGLATAKSIKFNIIKKILFRKANIKKETINKDESQITWIVETDTRHYFGIVKNISVFNTLSKKMLSNALVSRSLRKLANSREDYDTVVDLITNGTKVEVIKE